MNDIGSSADPIHTRPRRRRRRQDFLEAIKQSHAAHLIPVVDIGQRLREKRVDCGLTIRDLARKSGLNVNTLSMIENGKASPSLETLQQLSFALEIPIAAFFEDDTPTKKIAHYKANQRPSIAFTHGSLEDLGAELPQRGAETFLVTFNPNCNSGNTPIVHTGRETVFCLEGQLTYTIGEQTFLLEPGDSLCFEAHLPHRWRNPGAMSTRALLVISPFDVQDHPAERHFTSEVACADIEQR